ncbi:lipocalin-like domain-containing protein [Methylobacterium nigriterrae]|uniref:lipocalin-like domain-containing protein n=1 Tax=Methylobacterium nigriterrae TaxID=3127512 RepID=UPI0030135FF2
MRAWKLATIMALSVSPAYSLETKDIIGTWHLVSAENRILETNEVVDAYGGPRPNGWINYDKDGRMMVVCAYDRRETPTSKGSFTDQERIGLQKTFFAYAGTYTFDGSKVNHNIDVSSNQTWTGLKQARNVEYKDGNLIYTTQPQMNTVIGKMVVVTLVWERYKPESNQQ